MISLRNGRSGKELLLRQPYTLGTQKLYEFYRDRVIVPPYVPHHPNFPGFGGALATPLLADARDNHNTTAGTLYES